MSSLNPVIKTKKNARINLCRRRRRVWALSTIILVISIFGLIFSWLNPLIKAPLKPGLDFTGGTQIQLERNCNQNCSDLSVLKVNSKLSSLDLSSEGSTSTPNLLGSKVQILDEGKSVIVRMPFLSAMQANEVIKSLESVIGSVDSKSTSISTIGPTLGRQLLKSSVVSLLVAFAGISSYISFRYDSRYALLALVALAHDLIIVCGIFAWLGLYIGLEIDSLFAVALLTIAGYSVNDTVVVFDRIREIKKQNNFLKLNDQIDMAVSATITRTIYTSGTTLLPLIALIFFGGASLYWFSIALALGVLVGSWSSIALAPSLLSVWDRQNTGIVSDSITTIDIEA